MNILRCFFLFPAMIFSGLLTHAQPPTAFQRSVVVEATSLNDGNELAFNWLLDNTASGYSVFKKSLEAEDWGNSIASLPADATSWTDDQAAPGTAMEYAFFKHEFDPVEWNVCVSGNSSLRFEIKDMYGIGLCCNFGYGYYSITACDSLYAFGEDFAFQATDTFNLCNDTDSCVDVTITIFPDIFPNSTSWQLFDANTGHELATSGPVGTYISPRPAYGFIYAGTKLSWNHLRGKMLVLVDSTLVDSLQPELAQLHADLIADGWQSSQINVNRDATVMEVKNQILSFYQNHPDLRSLYIIGHVPVPYSGDIYPDTHTEHRGAWAADSYYADLDGIWTDSIANRTTAFFAYNHNVPNDNKFDQGGIPSQVELEVGRVDFYNMPAFSKTEVQLLRAYLRKTSAYKRGKVKTIRRALIDDNFGAAFAAPAASGWRNFGPLVGIDSIFERDYFTAARAAPYQWVYGCGSGSHVSSAGVGSTTDFANDSLQSIFSMLFGSQFGDWDNENNFLRAPLASGTTLSNCWAGNPPWTFHQMAMGDHLGACAKRTQNSKNGVYLPGPQMVHVALMGDPSLRMHMMAGITDLVMEQNGNTAELNWPAVDDTAVLGYYVYRADSTSNVYKLISPDIQVDTIFIDVQPIEGKNKYMVKTARLEQTPSGSYYNTGLGFFDSLNVELIRTSQSEINKGTVRVFPNPNAGDFTLALPQLASTFQVHMYNRLGQTVLKKEVVTSEKYQKFSLNSIPAGIYWLEIIAERRKWTQKVLIVK